MVELVGNIAELEHRPTAIPADELDRSGALSWPPRRELTLKQVREPTLMRAHDQLPLPPDVAA